MGTGVSWFEVCAEVLLMPAKQPKIPSTAPGETNFIMTDRELRTPETGSRLPSNKEQTPEIVPAAGLSGVARRVRRIGLGCPSRNVFMRCALVLLSPIRKCRKRVLLIR